MNGFRNEGVFCKNPAESGGVPHSEPPHRHQQVHRLAQRALRQQRPREGESRPRGRGGHVRVRLGVQTRRLLREEARQAHVRGKGDKH